MAIRCRKKSAYFLSKFQEACCFKCRFVGVARARTPCKKQTVTRSVSSVWWFPMQRLHSPRLHVVTARICPSPVFAHRSPFFMKAVLPALFSRLLSLPRGRSSGTARPSSQARVMLCRPSARVLHSPCRNSYHWCALHVRISGPHQMQAAWFPSALLKKSVVDDFMYLMESDADELACSGEESEALSLRDPA